MRMKSVTKVICSLFALMVLASLPVCSGQDVSGMAGEVSDQSGAAIPGALVTLKNATTGLKYTTTTSNVGFYRFSQIPPGQGYEVIFTAKGFTPVDVKNIYLTVATIRTQNATLKVGTQAASVEVTATSSEVTIDTSDATIGNTFDVNQLNSLPVEQRMDPTALFTMQPGVSDTGSVTGARVDQNNITLDGLDVNDFATGGAMQSNTGPGITEGFEGTIVGHAPIDSVEEFHATVGGYEADTGPASGGQFQLVTKSGTNKFHGNLNEYHRDPDLVANSWFNKDTTPIVPRNHLIQNQFGGNIGGPIIKDKLFFFFDYNNSKIISQIDTQRTVPLDTFRGDYPGGAELGYIDDTSTPSAISISYLPATGSNSVLSLDPSGVGEDLNWVGTDTCPAAPSFVSYTCRFPHSNNTVTGDLVNSGGYLFNAPDDDYETNYVGKVDYNISQSMKMFAVFHIVRENSVENPNEFAGDPPTNPFIDRTYSFAIGHTWVIGSNKTNQVTFGEVVQKYAFPNSYNPQGNVAYEFSDGTGPAIVSNDYLQPASQARRVPIPVLGDDFTWTKGNHTWQFGGTFKDILAHNTTIADFNEVEVGLGGYVLSLCGGGGTTCGTTSSPLPSLRPYSSTDATKSLYFAPGTATAAESSLQNLADYDYDQAYGFILGRIANDDSDFNYNAAGEALPQLTGDQRFYRYYQTQLYVQDSWKITPSITATYGLTYQKFSVPYETRGLESTEPFTFDQYFDAREAQSALGQTGPMAVPLISYYLGGKANGGPPLYTPEWRNLAPHVGFIYNPSWDKKSVFNASAGVVYDRTIINAVQLIQDGDSYLFQLSSPASFGISGDPYHTFADYDTPYTYGASGPRLDSNNNISEIAPYIVAPSTPKPPYQPFVAGGVPYGLQIGYAFNATIDPSLKTPYEIIYNGGFQRSMPWNMVLKISYAGRLGRRLLAQADANQVLDFPDNTGLSTQTFAEAFANVTTQLRSGATATSVIPQPWFEDVMGAGYTSFLVTNFGPFVQRGDIGDAVQFMADTGAPLNVGSAAQFSENTFYGNKGFSSYNALLATLQKNFSNGLHFDFNYTYSHSIDNVSLFANSVGDTGIGGIGLVCDVVRPRECRANSDFNEKSIITADATYQLPFGKGQMFLATIPHWEDELVGGWELSGITSWHTGQTWGTSSDAFVASYSNSAPGILIGPKSAVATHLVKNPGGVPGVNIFANQSTAAGAYEGPIGFHIGARNGLVGPRYFDQDLGLGKKFPIYAQRVDLRFRADAFNAFNHPNFSLPGENVYNGLDQQDVTSSTFGDISYNVGPPGNLNNGARVLQLSLRLEF